MNQALRYIARKILWTTPILVGIAFLIFGLGLVTRGDPAINRTSADPNCAPTEEKIQEFRAKMGLDDPALVQYGRWIWNTTHGDLGESCIDNKPVLGETFRLLPDTLLLSGTALLVITVVGLADGPLLTPFRDKFIDLLGRVLLVSLMSIPGFCLTYSMIWLPAQKLHILPTDGTEALSCFPILCLAISIDPVCVAIRLLRSSTSGELSEGYILTAQAKGLRKGQLISRHALRNSLVPSITYVASTFGGPLGGSVIMEGVLSVPGIGSYAFIAINNRDYIATQGYVPLVGVVFVLVCLLANPICAWPNPQIRLGG